MATELRYVERSVLMKEVCTQNFWSFELGTQASVNVPTWNFVVFQQNDRQHDQNLKKDTFYRLPVTSARCIIETEEYPDSAILLTHDDDHYAQWYAQVKGASTAPTEDDILQFNIGENDYRSSIDGDKVGYNLHVFDIRYQKKIESVPPIKIELKRDGVIPAGIYGYDLGLSNKLKSISGDHQRDFELI